MAWYLIKEGIASSEQIDNFYNLFDALAEEDGGTTAGGLPMITFPTLQTYFHDEGDATDDSESGELLQ